MMDMQSSRRIGFIGLGRMGQLLATRIRTKGIDTVVYNRTSSVTDAYVLLSAKRKDPGTLLPSRSVTQLCSILSTPRIVFLMVKAGEAVDGVIRELLDGGLTEGDILIDGGNSLYKDSVRRFQTLRERGVVFIDCGTSGGLKGAKSGASLMLGGPSGAVGSLSWLWDAMAVKNGWCHCGPSGAGHFVKMVHNGVEYGMNQAIGEGMELLAGAPYDLSLPDIAKVWSRGSVIRGWLVELLAEALADDPKLESYTGVIGGGQTGQWSLDTAKDVAVDVPVIAAAMKMREQSKTKPRFSGKVVSALRSGYGGHAEGKS